MNPFDLTGKIVLVTGASSGIGRQVAISCSEMGAQVYVTGRDKERLLSTLYQLKGNIHQSRYADLLNEDDINLLVDNLPPLDCVVHCAGIGHRQLCKLITKDDLDLVMGINFKAPVLLQTAIIKKKRINKNGSIIFISSLASHVPSIANSLYSASKGALSAYARCLELELAHRRIRVNCISPAMVWTDLILRDGISKEQLLEDEKRYPLRRYGSPEDIANLVLYLLSDASSWMTGSDIKITGGTFTL